MSLLRRDALKMVTAAPFIGFMESPQNVHARSSNSSSRERNERSWRIFETPNLSEIGFPLGGIGTGCVSLGGRGQLRDWEICNHANKGRSLANTFFAIWCKSPNESGKAKILESQIQPPYPGGFGLSRDGMPGMPRLKKSTFYGAYPFARIEFEDDSLPLRITLEAFNPFIPGNVKDSAIPVAIFYWRVENTTRQAVDVSIQMSLLNICGDDDLGKNLNEFVEKDGLRGLRMSTQKHALDHPKFGTMALVTPYRNISYLTRWARGVWWDDQSLFWNDFSEDGKLTEATPATPHR